MVVYFKLKKEIPEIFYCMIMSKNIPGIDIERTVLEKVEENEI